MLAIGIIGLVLLFFLCLLLFIIFGQLSRIADGLTIQSGECEHRDCEYNYNCYCTLCVLNRGKFDGKV